MLASVSESIMSRITSRGFSCLAAARASRPFAATTTRKPASPAVTAGSFRTPGASGTKEGRDAYAGKSTPHLLRAEGNLAHARVSNAIRREADALEATRSASWPRAEESHS